MASIYELNQPPHHPFWDFITNLKDHPFFGPHTAPHTAPQENSQPAGDNKPSEPAHEARPGPRGQRGAHGGQRRRGWGGAYRQPSGFGLGCGHPYSWGPFSGPYGRGGRGGPGRPGPGPNFFSHQGRGRGRGRGCRRGARNQQPCSPSPEQAREAGSTVAAFIQSLASHLGIPLDQILPQAQPQGQEQGQGQPDFVPPVDIIDTPARFIVHVSLPGAKREDLSVEYDAQESVLRVAGVVYRPGVDEELHNGLVVQERKDEVGVFERHVRLGTRENPARVVVGEIGARLEDGVLRVIVPRVVDEEKMGKNVVVECEGDDDDDTVREMDEYVTVDVQ